jgi:type II restriction enzyme
MQLKFHMKLAERFNSQSQKVGVLSEDWVDQQIYCPNCGQRDIDKYRNNKPVADFFCKHCTEDYELKSKNGPFETKVLDGAYQTMITRLRDAHNPNLFLLNYDALRYRVRDFLVIPKHFFLPSIIEKRKALSLQAQRAGWVGCNILLQSIPETGKIFFVRNGIVEPKTRVTATWRKTLFLRDQKEVVTKGWLLDIMRCIDKLKSEFTLDDVYRFENELKNKHPDNNHIKDKIRQQLQILRDKGYLRFSGGGKYRLTE